MDNLENVSIQCPYCWETIEVLVDCSIASQEYIEDCSVCCRPITILVEAENAKVVSIQGLSEDE